MRIVFNEQIGEDCIETIVYKQSVQIGIIKKDTEAGHWNFFQTLGIYKRLIGPFASEAKTREYVLQMHKCC